MATTYVPLGTLYLVQGFPYGLQSGLLPVLLRTQGLSLSHIGLTRVLYLPWLLKMFWSPLVDGRWSRRTWLRLSTGGLCICCLLCSLLPSESAFTPLAWLLLLMHVLSSLQDVALDAVSVAVLTKEQVGVGNSLQVVAYKLGSVLAGGGSLTLLDILGWRLLFLLLATAYLLAVLCIGARVLQGEEPTSQEDHKSPQSKGGFRDLSSKALKVPGTMWTITYVLIYKLGEQGSLSMVPLLLLDQGVSPAELGFFSGILSVGSSIAGSVLGGALLTRGRSLRSLLRSLLSLRSLGLVIQTLLLTGMRSDARFLQVCVLLSLVVQHFLAGVITTVTFSLMMHCTRQAEKNIQATHYSLLSSLEVLGKVCFSAVSGLLVDYLGVFGSFSLFIVFSCLPVLHLRSIPPTLG
uniref:Major facilitator superfamily domain-containing protein 3 n=1 Tax=Leptobrachium leishanense TaxID=445787 RepID=A0A8C5PLG1_9ANUR